MKLNLLTTTPLSPMQFVINAVNQLLNGGSNSVGKVTLTNNGTTTILYNNLITGTSLLFFEAQTANAAAVSASLWYDPTSVILQANGVGGSITLNHSASAHADLTFGYEVRN